MHDTSAHSNLPSLLDQLAGRGWSRQADFLPQSLTAQLAQECRRRAAAGELAPAAVGRASGRARESAIRGDRIAWLEPGQSPAVDAYLGAMEALRRAINRTLFLGLEDLESHFACYPPGAFYRRHLDRFRDDDLRTLSLVLYLNDDWQDDQGGALRLYLPDGGVEEVMPRAGTLACFLSADFPHEVLPATRERLSLTGWFRRRPLGR